MSYKQPFPGTFKMPKALIFLLSTLTTFSVFSEEVNLNIWDAQYAKISTGAKNDVQYNLYRKDDEPGSVYVELINRTKEDVKVDIRIVAKYQESEKIISLTGFVKSNGYWPNGFERKVACDFKNPNMEIRNITIGVIEEKQIIEIDSDGKQIQRYEYKFKLKSREKREDDDSRK